MSPNSRSDDQLYRSIFENSADGIVSIDGNGIIESFNPAAEKIFGYTADEAVGHSLNLLIPVNQQDDHTRYVKNSHLHAPKIINRERELNGLHKTGKLVPIEINVAPLDDGNEIKYVGIIRDISNRIEAEKELFNQADFGPDDRLHLHFLSAMKHAPVGISYWGPDERLIHWNDRFEQINSYFKEKLVQGMSFEDILRSRTNSPVFPHPKHKAEEWIADRLHKFRSGSVEREITLPSRDGLSDHHYILRQTRLPNSSTIIIISEETEFRQKEELQRSEQKMEAVGQLTGGIAHDFNNLLAVILGNLQLSLDMIENTEQVERRLNRALEAVRKGSSLTHRLLAFARQQALAPKAIDFNEILARYVGNLKRSLGDNITVSVNTQPNLHGILADPNQLENALLNLAINARDAMPGGGNLMIEGEEIRINSDYIASHQVPSDIEINAGNFVKISVTDNGEGMEPSVAKRVFEPFFTTKESSKGRGLGASMVFGFVKQSGGHLEIESAPGKGTTVSMFLPWSANEDTIPTVSNDKIVVDLNSDAKRVLLVEDDIDLREIITSHLTDLGYHVIDGGEGPNAMGILEAVEGIDILVSDVLLANGINGVDIATGAKNFNPEIKVLMLTGYAEKSFMESSDLPVLYKPFEKDQLSEALSAAIADRQN